MIATIWLMSTGCFSDYESGVDPDGDGIPWPMVGVLANANVDPEGYGAYVVAMGDVIYFAPSANEPNHWFMRSYDVTTGEFGGPFYLPTLDDYGELAVDGKRSDFCACGLSATFTSDSEHLYLLGNYGLGYDPDDYYWYKILAYEGNNRRGEAAAAYDRKTDSIVVLGGRDNDQSVLVLDVSSQTFTEEGVSLPIKLDHGGATIPAGDSIMYAAGGDIDGGASLISRDGVGLNWRRRANAPRDLGRSIGMDSTEDRIWYASSYGFLMTYEPSRDTWSRHEQKLPDGTVGVVGVSSEIYAVVASGSTTQIWRLFIDE